MKNCCCNFREIRHSSDEHLRKSKLRLDTGLTDSLIAGLAENACVGTCLAFVNLLEILKQSLPLHSSLHVIVCQRNPWYRSKFSGNSGSVLFDKGNKLPETPEKVVK